MQSEFQCKPCVSEFGPIGRCVRTGKGNINLVSGKSLMTSPSLQDSPTSRLVAGTDEEPNWDKLLNEAQFVALKISDPAVPAKTPLTHSKLSSTGSLKIQ